MMLERNLKRQVVKAIKTRWPDAWVYCPCDRTRAGIPDVLMCVKGNFVALELKVGNNRATPLQLATLDKIQRANGRMEVVWSVEEAMAVVDWAAI